MTNTISSSDILSTRNRVAELWNSVFQQLEVLRAAVAHTAFKRAATTQQLEELLHPLVSEILTKPGNVINGAGFCAAENFLQRGDRLMWWQGANIERVSPAAFSPGRTVVDLSGMEWYRVPAVSGEAHIAGPFVDYLCSNEITLTAAVPVYRKELFVGVVCADLLAADVERVLIPSLLNYQRAVLTNQQRRILCGAGDFYNTGEILTAQNMQKTLIPGASGMLLFTD